MHIDPFFYYEPKRITFARKLLDATFTVLGFGSAFLVFLIVFVGVFL